MVDFSTSLAPPGDLTDKDDELEVEGFATNKIKSLPLKIKKARKSSESQCFEGEPQKKTERRCSANEETRSSGSVAGKVFTGNLFLNCIFKRCSLDTCFFIIYFLKVFTGYLSAGSNCFLLLLVFATNLLCQVTNQLKGNRISLKN